MIFKPYAVIIIAHAFYLRENDLYKPAVHVILHRNKLRLRNILHLISTQRLYYHCSCCKTSLQIFVEVFKGVFHYGIKLIVGNFQGHFIDSRVCKLPHNSVFKPQRVNSLWCCIACIHSVPLVNSSYHTVRHGDINTVNALYI